MLVLTLVIALLIALFGFILLAPDALWEWTLKSLCDLMNRLLP